MARFINSVLTAGVLLLLSACKDTPSKNHGPIVLGDSSTIVTERDPQKLEDLVADLHPEIPSKDTVATVRDTVAAVKKDTAKTLTAPAIPSPAIASSGPAPANGLTADFKVTKVYIGNVVAKQSGNANLEHAGGAVYTLTSGTINGSTLRVTGNINKVSQRYQTIAVLKNGSVIMPVDALTNTTDWQQLKGSNGTYRITGLEPSALEYADDGAAAIRNAIARAAKKHRISRKKTEELLRETHNVRAANQKPLYTTLRSVMWKIDGKDEKGRAFSKQIRIDVPM